MKKMDLKRMFLLFILIMGGIFYLVYVYVMEPINIEIGMKKSELVQVKAQVEKNETTESKETLRNLQSDLSLEKEELKQIETEKIISPEEQAVLFKYLGDQGKKYNINLVEFKEEPSSSNEHYGIIEYSIKARGDNSSLVLFLDSLYKKYGAFQIVDMNYNRVKVTSQYKEETTTIEPTKGTDPLNSWDKEQLEAINWDIPKEILDDTQSSGENTTTTVEKLTTDLQLSFKIKFYTSK